MLQHKAVPLTVGHSTCGISKPFQINTKHQLVCATRRTLAQHFLAHVCTGQRHQRHVSTPSPNSLNNIVAPQPAPATVLSTSHCLDRQQHQVPVG